MAMDEGSHSGVLMKKKKPKRTKTRNMTRKETEAYMKEIREKGIITRFPKFIPPPNPFIPPNLTYQQKVDAFNALMASRPCFSISPDTYSPATAPGQLSLPELDESARVALFTVEMPKRKKKRVASMRKQKKKVASSSKKPKTNA